MAPDLWYLILCGKQKKGERKIQKKSLKLKVYPNLQESKQQADARYLANQRAHEIFESPANHEGERYFVGTVWTCASKYLSKSQYSALAQFKSLEN